MESEASTFESCEVMAALLGSSPLLLQSWRLCATANAAAQESFTTEVIEDVAYVAFSAVQVLLGGGGDGRRELVALEGGAEELFWPLNRHREEHREPAMADFGILKIFMNIFTHQNLLEKMTKLMQKSKSIVITGHSLGGAAATLCTLWLLSFFHSKAAPHPLLCITFGSPLIGNKSLSRAILRERWCGKFCHLVKNHDIMPRLLSTPLSSSLYPQLHVLLRYWHLSMASPQFGKLATQLSEVEKDALFRVVMAHSDTICNSREESMQSQYWPFGNFFLCSENSAICLDDAILVLKMLFLMLKTSAPNLSIEDHLNYEDCVKKVGVQHMERKKFTSECLPNSSYEASLALALQSTGIASQDEFAGVAENILRTGRRMGQTPNLNAAKLAISLSKITPYRAQIEWYKAICEEADGQLGYYDCFKQVDASVKHAKVNMNRHKLATFWNRVIDMWENNELPPDFNLRAKWVNASHFYKLLVEPLDIAEYYCRGKHIDHGHYFKQGRERRYEIFDKWWRGREVTEAGNTQRMKYAGLTQDSCFWARLEEAKDLLESIKCEGGVRKLAPIWKSLENFDRYAKGLIERKEVSKDVVAKNSSYTLWSQELRGLKLNM